MGCCCGTTKTIEQNQTRCNRSDYPRNPVYANVPQNVLNNPQPVPVIGGGGHSGYPAMVSAAGRSDGMAEGLAVGYMMGGDASMLAGIDGGPRIAIGGNYY